MWGSQTSAWAWMHKELGPGVFLSWILPHAFDLFLFHGSERRLCLYCSSKWKPLKHQCCFRHPAVWESFLCSQVLAKQLTLKNNKSIWGFLCPQAGFLESFDMTGGNSIFVCEVSLSTTWSVDSQVKWNITGEWYYVGASQLIFHLPAPGLLLNFICLSIALKQVSSLVTNRC